MKHETYMVVKTSDFTIIFCFSFILVSCIIQEDDWESVLSASSLKNT